MLSLADYLTPGSTANFTAAKSFSSLSSSADVQSAIESIANVRSVDVTRTASASNVTFMVTFLSNLGNVPLLLSPNSLITVNSVQSGICEVQAVVLSTDKDFSVSPSEGTFTLEYEGQYTGDINIGASAAEVKAALESLSKIGRVKVARQVNGNGFKWTVSFVESVGNLRLMTASPYRYEVQVLQTFGGLPTPLSGLISLSYGGDSVTVNHDASDADVRSALESMPSVGAVDVSRVAGSNGQFAWTITFRALIGNIDKIAVDTSLLFGSDATASVSEQVTGDDHTLTGYQPKVRVEEVVAGRPSYTGMYDVDLPGEYQIAVSQLVPGGLTAQYWDNQWQYGSPSVERVDPMVDFDWATGLLTQYSYDYVSVKWVGKLSVPKTDEYTLYLTADDFATVSLNHTVLIDGSGVCCIEYRASTVLTAGVFYDIAIDYVELIGAASISLKYSSSTLKKQKIPSSALFYAMPIVDSPFEVTVIPGAADYPYTIAFGAGLYNATAGVTAHFFVQTKDSLGNNQTLDFGDFDPSDLLSVSVAAKSGSVVYFGDLTYLGNGLFDVAYFPLLAGDFTLSVKMGDWDIYCGLGELLKCSPFSLTVSPGSTVSAMSEVESPANETMDFLVEAVAGEFSYFFIQAKDTYGNNQVKGGDPFTVSFTLLSNAAVQYKGSVDDLGDGRYTVRYSVPHAGSYDVAVALQAEQFVDESLTTCVGASAPFIHSRAYTGQSTYAAPSFCSLTHATLRIVHATLYAPSSTFDEGPSKALSVATTGITNSFTIQARDYFGNLRQGDNTTHFFGYGDGTSDFFTIELSKPEIGYSFVTSSAVDDIIATGSASGSFRLSFAGRTSQDIPSTVSAQGLEALLEALHPGVLDVSVTKTTLASPTRTKWSVTFLSMFDEWRALPASMSGAYSGTQLRVLAPTAGPTDPFFLGLSVARAALGGVYPVSFALWVTGTYSVRITSNGVEIQGSPLTLLVSNAAVDPTASLAYGSGLSSGTAGEASVLYVQAKDTRQTEVQYIALMGLYPIAGSFYLGFKGERTVDIPYNATAALLRDSLMALYSIGDIDVTRDAFSLPSANDGTAELTEMVLSSVWTVSFSGACNGNANGQSSGRCPASLGDEPLLSVNSDQLAYSAMPPNSHVLLPHVLVAETVKGYPGNNMSAWADLPAVGASLTHRTSAARLGVSAKQRVSCSAANSNATYAFSVQLLGDVFVIDTTTSVSSLESRINSSPQARAGRFNVTASGSHALVCSTAYAYTDLTFSLPLASPVPLLDILSADPALNVTVTAVVDAIDAIAIVPTTPGLFMITYTPTVKGVYDIYVTIGGVDVATDLTSGVVVYTAVEHAAAMTHNVTQVAVQGTKEYFSIQLRDRFGNVIDGPLQSTSALVLSIAGMSDPCQSSRSSSSASAIDTVLTSSGPNTDGVYSGTFEPTIAGAYTASVKLRTRGGLLGTYFRTRNLTSPVFGAHDSLFDGKYHEPYW